MYIPKEVDDMLAQMCRGTATAEERYAEPEIHIEMHGRQMPSPISYVGLDLWHYLRDRVDSVATDVQKRYDALVEEETWTDSYGSHHTPNGWKMVNRLAEREGWHTVMQRHWTGNYESALSDEIVCAIYADHPDDDQYGEYANSEDGFLLAISLGEYFWTGDVYFFRVAWAHRFHDVADFDIVLTEPEPETDPRQGVLVEMGPRVRRYVVETIRGNVTDDVHYEPWDDSRLKTLIENAAVWALEGNKPHSYRPAAPFQFDVEACAVDRDDTGQLRLVSGPMAGWGIDFHAPYAGD